MEWLAVLLVVRFQQRHWVTRGEVILHREPSDPRNADAGTGELSKRFTVVGLDLAGHGQRPVLSNFSNAIGAAPGGGMIGVGLGLPAVSLAGAAMAVAALVMLMAVGRRRAVSCPAYSVRQI